MIHSIYLPGGLRDHAEVEGAGEPILFLHADFVDGRMWDSVRDLLAPRFLVAVYDKLGYGRSDAATGPVNRLEELEVVIDALSLDRVHLVGCSNGGLQALDFTLRHPERVLSLTLVNASPSGWQPQGAPPPEILALIEASQRDDSAQTSELQLKIWFDGPQRTIETLPPELRATRDRVAIMNRIFVDRKTFFIADAVPFHPLDPPAISRLSEVRVPTLVIDALGDWPENRRASQFLANGIVRARKVEVAGAHVAPLEDPQGFVRLWEDFQFS